MRGTFFFYYLTLFKFIFINSLSLTFFFFKSVIFFRKKNGRRYSCCVNILRIKRIFTREERTKSYSVSTKNLAIVRLSISSFNLLYAYVELLLEKKASSNMQLTDSFDRFFSPFCCFLMPRCNSKKFNEIVISKALSIL